MPDIRSSFSFKSLKLDKKSVKTPNLAEVFFFFLPFGPHTHIKKRKLRTPPPKLDHSWFNTQACDVINPGKNHTQFLQTIGSNDSFTLS